MIREQGTDVLVAQPVSSGKTGVVTQMVITPELFPRMGQLGRSFQRIRYHRLRFEIVAGWPSTVSGSYVAGFIRDATDPVSEASAASTLLASGGTAVKFWQSTNVTVGALPDLYYTSSDPEEQRWASPGSFVIAVVGAPSSSASFEVFCHWDVSFYEPTYESAAKNAGFCTSLDHMYTSKGNKYISQRKGSDWTPVEYNDFTPPLYEGAILTVLSMRYASVQNSAQTFNGVFGFRQLKATGNRVYPVDDLLKESSQNYFDEDYCLFKGEKLEVNASPSPNEERAQWFVSTLGRHVRSGLSEPRPCLLRLERERRQTLFGSCSTPSTSETAPSSTIPCSKDALPNSQPSGTPLSQLPRLERETLSRLMEQWTASLQPLREGLTDSSDSDFVLVEAASAPPSGEPSRGGGPAF